MRTEASDRFERVVDPMGVVRALDRVCHLMVVHGVGTPDEHHIDVCAEDIVERSLELRPERVSKMLGFAVSREEAVDALQRLGIQVYGVEGGALEVAIPSWRSDLSLEIDLVEEVGRILGYERIPEQLPYGASTQGIESERFQFGFRVREALVGAGFQEAVCHSLVEETGLDGADDAAPRVAVRSALSAELSGLRRSLIPGLVSVLDRNSRFWQSPLGFFEVADVFSLVAGGYRESLSVAAVVAGPLVEGHWQDHGKAASIDFAQMAGIVERLFVALKLPAPQLRPTQDGRLHPGRGADILHDGKRLGVVGELHPEMISSLNVRQRILVFELDGEELLELAGARKRFVAINPYPGVTRDLAPRVAKSVSYSAIREAIDGLGIGILESYRLTDIYEGPGVPEGIHALTISFLFRSKEGTLSDGEVLAAMGVIQGALELCGGGVVPTAVS